ncbi:hypothetical protein OSTOST_18841, partial [Ostertagia ostertagi]
MTVLFDQFCDLVERGRKAGKSVLVCSAKGRNRAPAFCAAYLISKEENDPTAGRCEGSRA